MAVVATSPKAGVNKREQTLEGRQTRLAFWLLLPTFIVLVLVALYPLGRTFLASFTDEPFANPDAPVTNVGTANYQQLLSFAIVEQTEGARLRDLVPDSSYRRAAEFNVFGRRIVVAATDPDFIESVQNTVVFTVISVVLELVLGLGVALVVNIGFAGRGIMRAAMLIPWAIPTAISTVLWRNMLGDNSSAAINAILTQLGILEQSVAWRTAYPLASIIFVDVWKTMPYMALLLLAGLQTIPGDLYEAGSVDGASTWQKFWNITFPMLRATIVITLIFRTLDALRVFDLFQVMFGYATRSMATYNHEKLTASYEYGYASAIGVFIFVVIFGFTILYMSVFRPDEEIG